MYVTHKPEDHDAMKARFGWGKKPSNPTPPKADKVQDKSAPPGSAKLSLQSKLKEVLCTNLSLSKKDVQKMFDQASN